MKTRLMVLVIDSMDCTYLRSYGLACRGAGVYRFRGIFRVPNGRGMSWYSTPTKTSLDQARAWLREVKATEVTA